MNTINKAYNTYAQYPTTRGLITCRDAWHTHLFTQATDNIRARIRHISERWWAGLIPQLATLGRLEFEYLEMPRTPMGEIHQLADVLHSNSSQVDTFGKSATMNTSTTEETQ